MLGKLQQLADAIANTKLSAEEIYAMESIPRTGFIIDPVQAAISLGGAQPERLKAIEMALRLRQAAGDREANATLATIDRLLRKTIGTPINLSGVGPVPPAIGMQLADDVYYKRQHKKSKRPDQRGTVVEFASFNKVPMMDFDLPTIDHKNALGQIASQVTNLGDLEDRIVEYREKYPQSKLRLYATPGGYRIFDLAQSMTPAEHVEQSKFIGSDPAYVEINQQEFSRRNYVEPPGFRVRLSHKPRPGDFVAQPIIDYKGAPMNPRNVEIISTMHDEPIDRAYLKGGVPEASRKMLEQELPTASKALQAEVRRRLRL